MCSSPPFSRAFFAVWRPAADAARKFLEAGHGWVAAVHEALRLAVPADLPATLDHDPCPPRPFPTVLVSPGNAVGCACLAAMAALCANGTCDEDEQERVAVTLRRVRESSDLSVALRHSAMAAGLALAAVRGGPAAAIHVAVAAAEAAGAGRKAASRLLLPSHATPAFLLEEAAALTAAAVEDAKSAASSAAAIAAVFAEQPAEDANGAATAGHLPVSAQLVQRLAALLSHGAACRVRHLAFLVLQLLAVQPPTLYRPPPNESEEDAAAYLTAAAAAAPGLSMGVTHPAGVSAGNAPAAPKIKLLLPGAARSMAVSAGKPSDWQSGWS